MFARPPLLGVAAALVLFSVGIAGSAGAQAGDETEIKYEIKVVRDDSGAVNPPIDGQPTDEFLVDEPLKLVISKLDPDAPDEFEFKLRIESRDAKNILWLSEDETTIRKSGTDTAVAPGRRLQDGADDDDCVLADDDFMALFGSMTPHIDGKPPIPRSDGTGLTYGWPKEGKNEFTITMLDTSGQRELARQVSIVRSIGSAGTSSDPTESDPWQFNSTGEPTTGIHFYGRFFYPTPPRTSKRAGILIFGGSEGGLSDKIVLPARLLAAHGYTTLALAYWRGEKPSVLPSEAADEVPDRGVPKAYWEALPSSLRGIPLEDFRSALKLLAERADVRNDRLFISGTSRGSEAALWLAANPDFVGALDVKTDDRSATEALMIHGVVANVPSSVMQSCWDPSTPGCKGPAWKRSGPPPIPYVGLAGDDGAVKNSSAAEIHIEHFDGAVFLECAGADQVWGSAPEKGSETGCAYYNALKGRLKQRTNASFEAIKCPTGGHGLGTLVPYVPWDTRKREAAESWFTSLRGDRPFANQEADAALWPQLLAFLARSSQ